MINFTDSWTILLALVLYLLVLVLAKETKKSILPAIMLIVFLCILISHAVLLSFVDPSDTLYIKSITKTIAVDLVFVFLSFLTYLWIDEMEAKLKKKKTIKSEIDWFWKKV